MTRPSPATLRRVAAKALDKFETNARNNAERAVGRIVVVRLM